MSEVEHNASIERAQVVVRLDVEGGRLGQVEHDVSVAIGEHVAEVAEVALGERVVGRSVWHEKRVEVRPGVLAHVAQLVAVLVNVQGVHGVGFQALDATADAHPVVVELLEDQAASNRSAALAGRHELQHRSPPPTRIVCAPFIIDATRCVRSIASLDESQALSVRTAFVQAVRLDSRTHTCADEAARRTRLEQQRLAASGADEEARALVLLCICRAALVSLAVLASQHTHELLVAELLVVADVVVEDESECEGDAGRGVVQRRQLGEVVRRGPCGEALAS